MVPISFRNRFAGKQACGIVGAAGVDPAAWLGVFDGLTVNRIEAWQRNGKEKLPKYDCHGIAWGNKNASQNLAGVNTEYKQRTIFQSWDPNRGAWLGKPIGPQLLRFSWK